LNTSLCAVVVIFGRVSIPTCQWVISKCVCCLFTDDQEEILKAIQDDLKEGLRLGSKKVQQSYMQVSIVHDFFIVHSRYSSEKRQYCKLWNQ